jgi:hypothetical protein
VGVIYVCSGLWLPLDGIMLADDDVPDDV